MLLSFGSRYSPNIPRAFSFFQEVGGKLKLPIFIRKISVKYCGFSYLFILSAIIDFHSFIYSAVIPKIFKAVDKVFGF